MANASTTSATYFEDLLQEGEFANVCTILEEANEGVDVALRKGDFGDYGTDGAPRLPEVIEATVGFQLAPGLVSLTLGLLGDAQRGEEDYADLLKYPDNAIERPRLPWSAGAASRRPRRRFVVTNSTLRRSNR